MLGYVPLERRIRLLSRESRVFRRLAHALVIETIRSRRPPLEFVQALQVIRGGVVVFLDQTSPLWTNCGYGLLIHVLLDQTAYGFVTRHTLFGKY
jgi:hypothetical protein